MNTMKPLLFLWLWNDDDDSAKKIRTNYLAIFQHIYTKTQLPILISTSSTKKLKTPFLSKSDRIKSDAFMLKSFRKRLVLWFIYVVLAQYTTKTIRLVGTTRTNHIFFNIMNEQLCMFNWICSLHLCRKWQTFNLEWE